MTLPFPVCGKQVPAIVKTLDMSSVQVPGFPVSRAEDEEKKRGNHYTGLLLSLGSGVFFTLTAVIVKALHNVDAGLVACFRFAGILLFTIPILVNSGARICGPRDQWLWLLLRGLSGATALFLRYTALHYLPLANVTVILLSMPVFVAVFGRVFLNEECGIFHVILITVTLIGIGLTTKVTALFGWTGQMSAADWRSEVTGLSCSMAAVLIGAFVYVFVRKVKHVHHSVILFTFSVVAILESVSLTYATGSFDLPTDGRTAWLLIALTVLSFYGQFLMTKALQVEEAAIVSLSRSAAEVVCAFAFQMLLLQQATEVSAFMGAILVLFAILLMSGRKWLQTLAPDHRARTQFSLLLR